MRVRVTVTVDVDPVAWERDYGVDQHDRAALRADVKSYCYGSIAESAAALADAITVVS